MQVRLPPTVFSSYAERARIRVGCVARKMINWRSFSYTKLTETGIQPEKWDSLAIIVPFEPLVCFKEIAKILDENPCNCAEKWTHNFALRKILRPILAWVRKFRIMARMRLPDYVRTWLSKMNVEKKEWVKHQNNGSKQIFVKKRLVAS